MRLELNKTYLVRGNNTNSSKQKGICKTEWIAKVISEPSKIFVYNDYIYSVYVMAFRHDNDGEWGDWYKPVDHDERNRFIYEKDAVAEVSKDIPIPETYFGYQIVREL